MTLRGAFLVYTGSTARAKKVTERGIVVALFLAPIMLSIVPVMALAAKAGQAALPF